MAQLWHWDHETNRVWVCGQRVHHGALGLLITGVGVLCMIHDRRDLKQWLHRERLLLP
jgi:hypothetical protein